MFKLKILEIFHIENISNSIQWHFRYNMKTWAKYNLIYFCFDLDISGPYANFNSSSHFFFFSNIFSPTHCVPYCLRSTFYLRFSLFYPGFLRVLLIILKIVFLNCFFYFILLFSNFLTSLIQLEIDLFHHWCLKKCFVNLLLSVLHKCLKITIPFLLFLLHFLYFDYLIIRNLRSDYLITSYFRNF